MTGTIHSIHADRGFGFIRPSGGGKDIFFHVQQTDQSLAFDDQLVELVVEFEIVETEKGPRAVNVRPAE